MKLGCDVYYENAISTLKNLENNKDLVANSLFLLGCNVAAELFLSSVCAVASSRYGMAISTHSPKFLIDVIWEYANFDLEDIQFLDDNNLLADSTLYEEKSITEELCKKMLEILFRLEIAVNEFRQRKGFRIQEFFFEI